MSFLFFYSERECGENLNSHEAMRKQRFAFENEESRATAESRKPRSVYHLIDKTPLFLSVTIFASSTIYISSHTRYGDVTHIQHEI